MKTNLEGLHLWSVSTEPGINGGGDLWITTRRKSMTEAVIKATRFVRRKRRMRGRVDVIVAEHYGTIDA